MRYRPRWGLLTLGALIVIALFTYPVWRKFVSLKGSSLEFTGIPESQISSLNNIRRTQGPNAAATSYFALKTVIPAPTQYYPTPDGGRFQAVKGGQFIELDAVHTAAGSATVYRNIDNSLVLRFDDFNVVNGPKLVVILSTMRLPKTPGEVKSGDWFPVGTLKGTKGNQNYDLPPELKLNLYRSAVIFSDDLNTIYSLAPLD